MSSAPFMHKCPECGRNMQLAEERRSGGEVVSRRWICGHSKAGIFHLNEGLHHTVRAKEKNA